MYCMVRGECHVGRMSILPFGGYAISGAFSVYDYSTAELSMHHLKDVDSEVPRSWINMPKLPVFVSEAIPCVPSGRTSLLIPSMVY